MRAVVFALVTLVTSYGFAEDPPKWATRDLRAGIIGTDTSHVPAFTGAFHDNPQWRIKVVAAFKGGSPDLAISADRVEKFAATIAQQYDVEIVDNIAALLDKVDVVLLESVDGRPHLEQAKAVFEAGKPVFIDKPLAASLQDVREIVRLAKASGTPMFSSSSMRFHPDVPRLRDEPGVGKVIEVQGSSPLNKLDFHPDLFFYGVHGTEALYSVMGPGCRSVSRHVTLEADVTTGRWADGRKGVYHGVPKGQPKQPMLTVRGTKGVTQSEGRAPYDGLVGAIAEFFHTGRPPVDPAVTVEIFEFMAAAQLSADRDGAEVRLDELRKPKQDRVETERPNFVVIFTDDQGYGDLTCFGGDHVDTPHVDRLAREGALLSNFYVAAPVCTPSRAALMTGCYPKRVSMATGSNFGVLLAGDSKGLNPAEITMAEVLKSRGYATGCFGKWHLGDQPQFLPTRQGFDEYFGIPYSHDIHPFHPRQDHFNFPPLPLLDGERLIEADPDADYLTERVTERAVSFLERHKDEPFLLYVPHPIPHAPLHVSPPFFEDVPEAVKAKLAEEDGRIDYATRKELFHQAIAEIDWSVGQIVAALDKHKLRGRTLLLFTSDNGPAIGSAGPLRGRKGSAFEGGTREPTVACWPGRIPAGYECDEVLSSMDLLPTFAGLAGARVPDDRVIDGRDIWPILSRQPGARSPHEFLFFHQGNGLKAVRSGPWKLFPAGEQVRGKAGQGQGRAPALFNLDEDIGETTNVADRHPDVVARLSAAFRAFEQELGPGDQLTDACRPAGHVEGAKPLVPHRGPGKTP